MLGKRKQDEIQHIQKTDKEFGVTEIYAKTVAKTPHPMHTVGNSLSRMESLSQLHNSSAQIFVKLSQLEECQNAIIETLREDKEALGLIETTMKENLEKAKKNVAEGD